MKKHKQTRYCLNLKNKADRSLIFPAAIIMLFLSILTMGNPALGDSTPGKTIIIGGDYYYPPYEYVDKDGNPTGYNVELTRAIGEVMGLNIEIRLGSWSDMRKALLAGEIDALQGIVFTSQRKKFFDFTPNHAIIHQSIFYRKGSPRIMEVPELTGKEIIVQKAGSMHENFVRLGMGNQLILTDTHANALRLLASGKHDYAVVANLPGLFLGRKLGLSNIVTSGKPIESFKYCYAVKKGNSEMLALINEGLSILKNTGRHQQIYDKWLGSLEPRAIPWNRIIKLAAIVLIPLLLTLCGIIIWNRTLKKEVENRTREISRQQKQLIQADKLSTLGILVSGVAHEINNPNSLILLNTPAIIDSYEDCRPILEKHYENHGDFMLGGLPYSRMREELPLMLTEMLDGGKRIKRIVEDLKDFARQDNSESTEKVDINMVVKTAIRLVENTIKKTTSSFHVTYGDDIPPLTGNTQRIEQVVVNLILNACQALTGVNQEIRVATKSIKNQRETVVEVSDEGAGIAPEHLTHLTDPFFTTKRESGGTGLGLSVSANIVKEHNGTMEFISTPGKGTTVLLSFPSSKERSS